MRKRERPRDPADKVPVRARATDTSLSVALENHLMPLSAYLGPYGWDSERLVAVVSVRETSEPPGRYNRDEYLGLKEDARRRTSVIHCPAVYAAAGSRLVPVLRILRCSGDHGKLCCQGVRLPSDCARDAPNEPCENVSFQSL